MNEDVTQPFSRTSLEVAVARLEVQLVTLNRDLVDFRADTKIAHSELNSTMQALEARERERNGSIRELVQYRRENEQHWGEHMAWAGQQATDTNQIGEAVAKIESERHDGSIRSGVIKAQAKFILGGGLGGGTIVGIAVFLWNIFGVQIGAIMP